MEQVRVIMDVQSKIIGSGEIPDGTRYRFRPGEEAMKKGIQRSTSGFFAYRMTIPSA